MHRSTLALLLLVILLLAFTVSVRAESVYLPLTVSSEASTPTFTATSTPTATPTPTNTPTPIDIPTITPTATDVAQEMTVMENHLAYIDSIDYLHIVGEVQNNTGERARFVKVTANLFNSQDQLVDTDYTYTSLDVMPIGERACFDLIFSGSPDYAYYTFETSYSSTTEASLPIAVFGDSGTYDPTFDDWYNVVGQARNDSSVNAEFVKIIGTLYRNNGQVLDCDYTYTNADVLTPGQVSTWKLTFLYAPRGAVGSYRLQAQGREE